MQKSQSPKSLQVQRAVFQKSDIDHLQPEELDIVVSSLTLLNSLNTLLSCHLCSMQETHEPDDAESDAQSSQALFFLLLLAGELCEAWNTINKVHQSSRVWGERVRAGDLGPDARLARDEFMTYFAHSNNPIQVARNKTAFHHDPKLAAEVMQDLPGNWSFHLWVTRHLAGTRSSLGTLVAAIRLSEVCTAQSAPGAYAPPWRTETSRKTGQPLCGFELLLEDVHELVLRVNRYLLKVIELLLPLEARARATKVSVSPGLPVMSAFPDLVSGAQARSAARASEAGHAEPVTLP